jgi:hypothetical protein
MGTTTLTELGQIDAEVSVKKTGQRRAETT